MTRKEYLLLIAVVAVAGLGAWAVFGGQDGQMVERAVALLISN